MLNEMNHPRSAFGAPPQGGTVHPEVSKDASGPAEPDPRRPLDASVVSAKRVSGPVIRLHPADNVVVARVDVAIGMAVPSEGFVSRSQVPAGHKLAARAIRQGEAILKYNVCIGFASTDITAGAYVHSHNTEFREFDRDPAIGRDYQPTAPLPPPEQAGFQGYVRADGEVGTRNYIGILSTVNCSATVVHKVAAAF